MGGSKVALGVSRGGEAFAARETFPTPRGSARNTLRLIGDRLAGLLRGAGGRRFAAIGLGVPGVCDPARGLVRWAPNLPGWREVPAGSAFRRRFRCPVALENDADMAALGEASRGGARTARDAVTLTIGTGIGGGLIVNGALARGASGVAGAAGWLRAGRRRLEDVAAGPALRGGSGRRAAAALGGAVADLVSLLNPERVVLGGGVMDGPGRTWLPAVRRAVRRHAQPFAARRVRILRSPLGTAAGLWGALAAAREAARR